MNHPTLYPTPEIVSAIICYDLNKKQRDALTESPKEIIGYIFDVEINEVDIKIVHNSPENMNLILPYYDGLENISAQALNEAELKEVSGGELVIVAIIGIFAGVSAAVGVSVFSGFEIAKAVLGKEELEKRLGEGK